MNYFCQVNQYKYKHEEKEEILQTNNKSEDLWLWL